MAMDTPGEKRPEVQEMPFEPSVSRARLTPARPLSPRKIVAVSPRHRRAFFATDGIVRARNRGLYRAGKKDSSELPMQRFRAEKREDDEDEGAQAAPKAQHDAQRSGTQEEIAADQAAQRGGLRQTSFSTTKVPSESMFSAFLVAFEKSESSAEELLKNLFGADGDAGVQTRSPESSPAPAGAGEMIPQEVWRNHVLPFLPPRKSTKKQSAQTALAAVSRTLHGVVRSHQHAALAARHLRLFRAHGEVVREACQMGWREACLGRRDRDAATAAAVAMTGRSDDGEERGVFNRNELKSRRVKGLERWLAQSSEAERLYLQSEREIRGYDPREDHDRELLEELVQAVMFFRGEMVPLLACSFAGLDRALGAPGGACSVFVQAHAAFDFGVCPTSGLERRGARGGAMGDDFYLNPATFSPTQTVIFPKSFEYARLSPQGAALLGIAPASSLPNAMRCDLEYAREGYRTLRADNPGLFQLELLRESVGDDLLMDEPALFADEFAALSGKMHCYAKQDIAQYLLLAALLEPYFLDPVFCHRYTERCVDGTKKRFEQKKALHRSEAEARGAASGGGVGGTGSGVPREREPRMETREVRIRY